MTTPASGPIRPVRVTPTAGAVVRVALYILPAGSVRDRYRHEHDAELRALPPGRQVRYAFGALLTSVDLRRATSADASSRAAEPTAEEMITLNRKPLLCRLNLHHRWRTEHAPEGGYYRRCTKCGKDDPGGFTNRPNDIMGGPIQF